MVGDGFKSLIIPFAIGIVLGSIWTLVFGPMLDRINRDIRNWFAYGVEAVGVFVMSVALYKLKIFTPLNLLGSMISAGVGMFLIKAFINGNLAE